MLRIQLRLLSLLGMHSTILISTIPDSTSDLDDSISTITGTINYLFSLPLALKSICVTVWMRISSPHLFSFSQTISHTLIYSSRDGLPSTFQLICHGHGGVTTISLRPGFKLLRLKNSKWSFWIIGKCYHLRKPHPVLCSHCLILYSQQHGLSALSSLPL